MPRRRGQSRLLVLEKTSGKVCHNSIRNLPELLRAGDCLVVNDTKVIPARLRAVKVETGARIEILLHREISPVLWETLARPCRRLQIGTQLQVGTVACEVAKLDGAGRIQVRFATARAAATAMNRFGEPPLPPYIRRFEETDWRQDRKRYQTVFAAQSGSVAAPTAGLHFSPALLTELERRGVKVAKVTLHVGWGTFAPLPEGDLTGHELHSERFRITRECADTINQCRARGGRIIACGTTATRTLESATRLDGTFEPAEGETRLFIQPGYTWKAVDGLLTNFHLPCSSLLMLVCAFAGRDRVLAAYAEAIQERYRFYSYGDAMLLL